MRDLDNLFVALSKSSFRRRFRLQARERAYLREKGLNLVLKHAREILRERLAPAEPHKDGRQTPWRGHPVFVAQHATATCCRGCLEQWHGIPKGNALGDEEMQYIIRVIGRWLEPFLEVPAPPGPPASHLFQSD
jgi:hypothetical protein